jgi:hypothetical protein
MAYQVRGTPPLFCDRRVILERKELALLLSVVVSECAGLEADITWLYATLLGKFLPHNQRKGPPFHPVGFQIFDAVNSTNQRTQLIKELAARLEISESLMKELNHLIKDIKRAFEKRNDLAHVLWGTHDDLYPNALIGIRPGDGKHMAYEESDFNEAINVIIAASDAVHAFQNKIRNHLKRKKRPR